MDERHVQVVLEELVGAVASLCGQVSDLIDERAKRSPLEDRAGIEGKATQVRKIADSLRAALGTEQQG